MHDLASRRAAFAASIRRYVRGAEHERFLAVLDDFVDWSLRLAPTIHLASHAYEQSVVSFEVASTGRILWAAYPQSDLGAKLEILPRVTGLAADDVTDNLRQTVRGVTGHDFPPHAVMLLPFASLKKAGHREAVQTELERFLQIRNGG